MNRVQLICSTLAVATMLLLTQCQQSNPRPPTAQGFDAPIPPDTSYLSAPLTFQLRELEDKINRELDPVLVGKGAPGGKQGGAFPFRVARSARVQIHYANQQLTFSTPLQLWITKPFSGDKTPPDKPFCSLRVNFRSPLHVTPNWRLASRVKFTKYEWIIKPTLRVLGRDIALTRLAQRLLNSYQSTLESTIDSAVYNELRLDQLIKPIWQDIQKPLLINRPYGLWLLPKPIGVEAGPVSGTRQALTTHLRVAFQTRTVLKPQPPRYVRTPLPLLEKQNQVGEMSDLHLLSVIPYADINRILTSTLSQKNPELALGMLTIRKASVFGGQRALLVKAEVSGLLDGTIYLRGRPTFDTLTNSLSVTDLDFDAQTGTGLPRLTSWLWRNDLLESLKPLLTIQLGQEIAQLPRKIKQAYEKSGAGRKTDLSIHSFRFAPRAIAIRPTGIQTLIRVESKVSVQLRRL